MAPTPLAVMPDRPHRLAIYDMDRTITVRGTFAAFLVYAVPRIAPWRIALAPLLLFTSLAYALRIVSRKRLKELNLALLLGRRIDMGRRAAVFAGYADRVMTRNLHAAALAQIASDRAAGYRIVLATASFELYVAAIADRLGIAAGDVIATRLMCDADGQSRAQIDGKNCYGADKLAMVQSFLAVQGIDRSAAVVRFYTDHVSDAPCLMWADEAVATTPHAPLRALAQAHGWAIVDWAGKALLR